MFCKSCGAPINQGEAFCTACGTPVEQQPAYTAPVCNTAPVSVPAPDNTTLVYGILSLALGGIFGIIFGAMAKSKCAAYLAQGGTLEGTAKVGYILGKVGFILGIVSTIVLSIYLLIYFVAIGSLIGIAYY